ncbi:AAA family ATPase [Aestuariibius sp. 2305UL40-4]|uniref:AAA family ATPase n=1 Tax=Aestuariibius violaceus TaxID=3234132 RepID=UPI00345EB12B
MIIVLNGYPGTGKLTIGRELAALLHGRLLDIHTVYNVAFALTEFKSPEFRDTVEKVEAIAHDLILKLPPDQPVILTTVLAGDSAWGAAEWQRIVDLGKARPPFCVVHIHCDENENIRRIQSEERDLKRKPRDPSYVLRNHAEAKPLLGADEDRVLNLDTTHLTARQSASTITDWLDQSPF